MFEATIKYMYNEGGCCYVNIKRMKILDQPQLSCPFLWEQGCASDVSVIWRVVNVIEFGLVSCWYSQKLWRASRQVFALLLFKAKPHLFIAKEQTAALESILKEPQGDTCVIILQLGLNDQMLWLSVSSPGLVVSSDSLKPFKKKKNTDFLFWLSGPIIYLVPPQEEWYLFSWEKLRIMNPCLPVPHPSLWMLN